MKIVIAGGTGFIGKYLENKYKADSHDVMIISRSEKNIHWNETEGIINALENTDVLINLAGKSVDCRYTDKNKQEIIESRTFTTAILGNAIKACKNPPLLWLNSSTATIYRHAEDKQMTEEKGEIGSGFSVEVAKTWEKEFFNCKFTNTRQVALRIAIVLGKEGGAMHPLKNLVKFGLGGKQGIGNQMFSWIHIEDLKSIIDFIIRDKTINGILNCASPIAVSNAILMQTLRKTMNVSFGLPSPTWLLKIGAFLISTETELILKSRWVFPQYLIDKGFKFKFNNLDQALDDIIKDNN